MIIVTDSLDKIFKQLFLRVNKQMNINADWGHPAMLNDVEIEYVGRTDDKYPPYHLGRHCIGNKYKLWAGTSGCNYGYVDSTGGCYDCPASYENQYIFRCDITQVDI